MNNGKNQTSLDWLELKIQAMIANGGSEDLLPVLSHIKEARKIDEDQARRDFSSGYMHGDRPLNHDVIDKWYAETYGGSNQKQ